MLHPTIDGYRMIGFGHFYQLCCTTVVRLYMYVGSELLYFNPDLDICYKVDNFGYHV